jgi:hypothetical protein
VACTWLFEIIRFPISIPLAVTYTVPLTGAIPICAGVIRTVKVTEAFCRTVGLELVMEVLVLTLVTVTMAVPEEAA